MGELLKATLQEVSADANQTAIGDPVPVQFNPESLKLRLQNQTDGGRSRGRQRRQHNGASSTTLSMDLVFDTADEGTDDAPVSVRTKTAIVEKYVLPKQETSDAPPRLQFQWDQLIIAGIVESVDIDFDHFAENGAPLRAKVSLSIKEQDPQYTYIEGASGPAARNSTNTQPAGSNTTASPGRGTNNNRGGGDNSDRSDTALEGETAPDFLARHGLDPSAWRGLGVDLSAGLSLQAGVEIGFNASLGAGLGVGARLGVHAQAGISLEASLSTGSKKVDGDGAGLALSAAGGLQPAMETLKIRDTSGAANATRQAFGLGGGTSGGTGIDRSSDGRSRPPQASRSTGSVSTGADSQRDSTPGTTTPLLPKADPRATSFGYGVPLREFYPTALTQTEIRVCSGAVKPATDGGPAFRTQKTTPPWEALPKRDRGRALADSAEAERRQAGCAPDHPPCNCH